MDNDLVIGPELVDIYEVLVLEFLLSEVLLFVQCIFTVIVYNFDALVDERVAHKLSE